MNVVDMPSEARNPSVVPGGIGRSFREKRVPKTVRRVFPMLPHSLTEARLDILHMYSSAFIFIMYLFTLESVIVSAISAATTLFYCRTSIGGHVFAGNLSWTFISFAVVFPLTYSIGEAFKRREEALRELAGLKATIYNVCLAHTDWSWGTDPDKGRDLLPKVFVENTKEIILGALQEMREGLAHCEYKPDPWVEAMVWVGGPELRALQHQASQLLRDRSFTVSKRFQQLSLAVENMKALGLPGPEASRIRQFAMIAQAHWEKLCMIKNYRTPQATRAFARIYILLHPFFFGPYYAYVAGSLAPRGSSHTDEYFAMALSILTSLAMVGLFNVRYALEDPFNEEQGLLDAIHLQSEFDDMVKTVCMFTTAGACNEETT